MTEPRDTRDDIRPDDRLDEKAAEKAAELAREVLRAQVAIVRKALGDDVAVADADGGRPDDDADTAFLYHPRRALVRERDLETVVRFFAGRDKEFVGQVHRVDGPEEVRVPGLAVLELPTRTDGGDPVLRTIAELERTTQRGIATPDHVLYVCPGGGKLCPAIEPVPPRDDRPWPPPAKDPSAGKGVRVGVVDTGLWTPAVTSPVTPWMDGVVCDPTDEEVVDPSAIHPYAGHGTFVAGVVQCLAPASRVEVEGALTHGGAVHESAICQQLHEALLDDDHPQLVSISAGTHTRHDFALLAFEMLAAAHGLDDGESTIVLAAAGNDGSSAPFWPAAFPWVVGVGSVDPDGTVSDFSNHGRWVDVYARGSDLVNAFPEGDYTCVEPPDVGQVRTFKGLARWSGTSFSTPVVTGLIAARMSAASESAAAARDAVLASGSPGVDPEGRPIRVVGPL